MLKLYQDHLPTWPSIQLYSILMIESCHSIYLMEVISVMDSNPEEKRFRLPQNISKSSPIISINQQELSTMKGFTKQLWSTVLNSLLQEHLPIADSLTTKNSDKSVMRSVLSYTVTSPILQVSWLQEKSLQPLNMQILLWPPLIKLWEEQEELLFSIKLVPKKTKKVTKSLMTTKPKSMELFSLDCKEDLTCTALLVLLLEWVRQVHLNSNFINNK